MPYASKYYDSNKAHEYYMRHRQLKGYANRYGGSRGNGTSAASTAGYMSEYRRSQLNANPMARMDSSAVGQAIPMARMTPGNFGGSGAVSNSPVAMREARQKRLTSLSQELSDTISATQEANNNLRAELSAMSPAERAANRAAYQQSIDYNKALLAEAKQRIQDEMQRLREEAQNESETNAIYNRMNSGSSTVKNQIQAALAYETWKNNRQAADVPKDSATKSTKTTKKSSRKTRNKSSKSSTKKYKNTVDNLRRTTNVFNVNISDIR